MISPFTLSHQNTHTQSHIVRGTQHDFSIQTVTKIHTHNYTLSQNSMISPFTQNHQKKHTQSHTTTATQRDITTQSSNFPQSHKSSHNDNKFTHCQRHMTCSHHLHTLQLPNESSTLTHHLFHTLSQEHNITVHTTSPTPHSDRSSKSNFQQSPYHSHITCFTHCHLNITQNHHSHNLSYSPF